MRRKKGTDLLPALGRSCPHVDNDHPPICQQSKGTTGVESCLHCPEYLNGTTDISLDEKLRTENMKMLLFLRDKRDNWYAELEPIYEKVHTYDDPIAKYEKLVREEQEANGLRRNG